MARNTLRYQKILRAERARLLAQFAASKPDPDEIGPVNDEDWASFSHDRFVSVRLQDLDHKKLRLIDLALARLNSGEFGQCIDCGKPISSKRLEVIPWASRCVNCQEERKESWEDRADLIKSTRS